MDPIGHLPTPYGVSVPVFFDRGRSPKEEECYFHQFDDCMTLAGVYHKADRQRCWSAFRKAKDNGEPITFDIFLRNGGRKVPRIALEKPREPVYPRLPHDMELDIPVENWVTTVMDAPSWPARATVLLDIIGSNLDNSETWAMPQEVHALALSQLLTASLEHILESEVDCLEAAAIYALTLHYREWSAPAVEWLQPFNATWFRDWIAARPTYPRFGKLMRIINPELPEWLAGGPA